MKPTVQQQNFLDLLKSSTCNILVEALAGCGKSTLIMMGVKELVKSQPKIEIGVCAFNKAIQLEMNDKIKEAGFHWKQVNASTLHGMGFGLLKFAFKPEIDDKKVLNLVKEINDPDAQELRQQITKLVKMAKQEGFGFFDDRQIGDVGAWYRMADHYDINGFDDTTQMDLAVEHAQRVYKRSLSMTDVIDFDDMILMPLIKNMRVKFQKDVLFVDEAQDLSRSRQALARKFVKPSGRMIIVGDRHQAIYGFSGADAAALDNMSKQLNATALPLSVTWRCPKAVVRQAQTIVPGIEAADTAPEGEVAEIADLPEGLGPETAILCRNTAPLIDMAYDLIRHGTACKVEGRDIGQGLIVMLNRWKVKTVDAFLNRLRDYQERETQKALAKGKDERVEQIEDKCDTLRAIANECLRQDKKTVADMVAFVEDLFADGAENVTTLATYHRSKGREWPTVILLEHAERCPSKFAKQAWQIEQENNLAYVAFTRAQERLLFLG
jgi:DNA helicase-2/ATP-dependent DNA helicase PcrA